MRPATKPASSYSWQKLVKYLIAILIGNAIFFLVLSPHLPPKARHGINRIDLGLLIDFWVCVVVYGAIELMLRKRRRA
jgi:hypothetical protein